MGRDLICLSNKYYIYLYTYVISVNICYCYLSYDVEWFCFWAWRLSTERVVAQPPNLYLFPLGVNVLATIGGLLPCVLLCDLMKWCNCTLEFESSSVDMCNS